MGQVNSRSRAKKVEFFDVATVRETIYTLCTMSTKPQSDPSVYPISDVIQIMKEIRGIIDKQDQTKLTLFLRRDEHVANLLMVLLTRDYALTSSSED